MFFVENVDLIVFLLQISVLICIVIAAKIITDFIFDYLVESDSYNRNNKTDDNIIYPKAK